MTSGFPEVNIRKAEILSLEGIGCLERYMQVWFGILRVTLIGDGLVDTEMEGATSEPASLESP